MKIHVQIRIFTCCLNMGLYLKILKMSPESFTESFVDQTDQFADAFVCENVAHIYSFDVVTMLRRSKVYNR